MSLLAALKPAGPSGFGYGSTAEDVTRGIELSGKCVLLTGCSSGLGLETLRVLTLRGAHVLAAARTEDKATAACATVAGLAGRATALACELSQPASVAACVARVRGEGSPLDAIVCNAGIMALPRLEQCHGVERQFFTNHIGHFMLVTGLLEQLADEGRVVVLSSDAHKGAPRGGIQLDNLSGERGYQGWTAYGQSKLANLLFANELARRLAGTGRTANAVHPGVIRTNLTRHMQSVVGLALSAANHILLKNVAQGAATQCYVAVHPSVARTSGRYFADCNEAKPSRKAADAALATALWRVSEQIVARVSRHT